MDSYFSAGEIVEQFDAISLKKVSHPIWKMLVLGFMAGGFISMGANASSAAAFSFTNFGVAKLATGVIFPVGLVFVILGGAELFTGNMLIVIGYLHKKVTLSQVFKNWFFIFLGNLLGAVTFAFLVSNTIQFDAVYGELGGYVLKVAAGKTSIPFKEAFISGVLCNWIVCQTVFAVFSTRNVAGKILICFLPIVLFVVTGFEHIVANMYYLFAGLFVKSNPLYVEKAIERGVDAAKIANIDLSSILVNNFLPVTLGNMIGGILFVAVIYAYAHKKAK